MSYTFISSTGCAHSAENRIPDANGLTQCKVCGSIIIDGAKLSAVYWEMQQHPANHHHG